MELLDMQTSTTCLSRTFSSNSTTVLEFLADTETPVTAFEKLSRGEPYGFLFESAHVPSGPSRFSIMGVDPLEKVCIRDGQGYCLRGQETVRFAAASPLELLRERQRFYSKLLPFENVPAFLPFSGGFVGYLAYPLSSYLYGIKRQSQRAVDVPDLFLCFYDSAVVFDHLYRKIYVISHRGADHADALLERLEQPAALDRLSLSPLSRSETGMSEQGSQAGEQIYDGLESSMTRSDYFAGVRSCKEKICAGEAFQIVLSQRFSLNTSADPFSVYRLLQSLNPSPYGYFLKFPEFSYLGASPETLVALRQGRLTLAALAGTRRRGRTAEEDAALEAELRSSEKEMAEHMMLVDLGRNDLGRVARAGTVTVNKIASVVRFENVMHLASEVTGDLDCGLDAWDAVASCFPAGTVSGAPKIRAMQILAELEPEERGIYAGMVGYFDCLGNCDGAIAIRSALLKDGRAYVNAGAGIVYDSDENMEYEETRAKALSVVRAIRAAGQVGEKRK
jgi:anthranilate synthase component I